MDQKVRAPSGRRGALGGRIPCAAVNWLIWTPLIVLGTLLVLFGLAVLLGRVAGGRYLRPIVVGLSKVPFLKRLLERMSNAALERENPELASAIRKLQRFGTPTTPEGSAARPGPPDTRRTSRLHAGRRPAGGGTSGAEPRGPSSGDRSAAGRRRRARTQEAEALTSKNSATRRYEDHVARAPSSCNECHSPSNKTAGSPWSSAPGSGQALAFRVSWRPSFLLSDASKSRRIYVPPSHAWTPRLRENRSVAQSIVGRSTRSACG